VAVVVVALVVLGAAACGSAGSGGSRASPARRTLRVFAASSLTEAFGSLGDAFESSHPGVDVRFNFAASSALAQQITDGAPADVFVSADEPNMAKVVAGGEVAGTPVVVARNRLSIVVEKGNPTRVGSLRDLARPGMVVVLCSPQVPCGRYAAAALAKAGVTVKPASLEENVKAVVTKVALGEADAGVVYVTDVRAASTDVDGVAIDIAGSPELQAVYPAAVLRRDGDRSLARAWIDFLRSPDAQRTLASFGFLGP
jgi:molybdate transport system substrate-binding protein